MLLRMKNLLSAQPCAMLERIQTRFENVRTLIKEAVKNKKRQQLRNYMHQLDVLLRRSESLRIQFVASGSYDLPYFIDDEIKYCKGMLKSWE